MTNPHDTAYWEVDEEGNPVSTEGIKAGRPDDSYSDSHPSKADRGFNR